MGLFWEHMPFGGLGWGSQVEPVPSQEGTRALWALVFPPLLPLPPPDLPRPSQS